MSELTQCNYCRLQSIQRDAKRKGKRVIMAQAGYNKGLGGHNVHVVGKGEQPNEKNKVCWFMMVSGVCVC